MKKYFVASMLCVLTVYGAVSYSSAEAESIYPEAGNQIASLNQISTDTKNEEGK